MLFGFFTECDRYLYYTFCFSKVLKYFQHYFCFITGTVHFERFGKRYHLSWLEEGLDKKFTWTGARNYCRRFCMDSITFNSKREYQFFKRLISDGKLSQTKIRGRSLSMYAVFGPFLTPSPLCLQCVCICVTPVRTQFCPL